MHGSLFRNSNRHAVLGFVSEKSQVLNLPDAEMSIKKKVLEVSKSANDMCLNQLINIS